MYHLLNNCDYYYDNEKLEYNEEKDYHKILTPIKGVRLLGTSYKICEVYEEWEEDAKSDLYNTYYYRK